MTTTPNEPVLDPQVVPSGDPAPEPDDPMDPGTDPDDAPVPVSEDEQVQP